MLKVITTSADKLSIAPEIEDVSDQKLLSLRLSMAPFYRLRRAARQRNSLNQYGLVNF